MAFNAPPDKRGELKALNPSKAIKLSNRPVGTQRDTNFRSGRNYTFSSEGCAVVVRLREECGALCPRRRGRALQAL